MLCETCRRGLDGMSDPATTTRSDTVSLAALQEPGVHEPLEAERYVYGHHVSRRSFQESTNLGCCMWNRVQFCLSLAGHNRLFDEEKDPSSAYFSTFKVRVHGDRVKMTVMVGGQEWGSDLVPVGIEEYDEKLSFHLDDNTNGPRSWKLVEDWVNNCAAHHKLCGLQAKSSSTF